LRFKGIFYLSLHVMTPHLDFAHARRVATPARALPQRRGPSRACALAPL